MQVPWATAQIVVDVSDADLTRYIVFFSPVHVTTGFTLWLFDAFPTVTFHSAGGDIEDVLAFVDFPGVVYLVLAFRHLMVAVLYRDAHLFNGNYSVASQISA